MSDNLPPELVQEELETRLRIPTEVWTDVFKLLPRRILVQQVAPVCYYFKEISNNNVKNVHVIENANQFSRKLEKDDLEAKQQLEHLAANECQLAKQFQFKTNFWVYEKNQSILLHCPDLFNGCKIRFFSEEENKNSNLFLECLSLLEKTKPIQINVIHQIDQVIGDYWQHPTFQNCNRALLHFWSNASMMTTFVNIFEWLRHRPIDEDCGGAADHQHVRCMLISSFSKSVHIDWLLDRCSKDIQQAQEPAERRPFVLSFECWDSDWPGFDQFRRIENKSTGEVLLLERVPGEDGGPNERYRLRRCLAEEEAKGKEEFYAEIFKCENGIETFKLDEEKPEVTVF